MTASGFNWVGVGGMAALIVFIAVLLTYTTREEQRDR